MRERLRRQEEQNRTVRTRLARRAQLRRAARHHLLEHRPRFSTLANVLEQVRQVHFDRQRVSVLGPQLR